MSAGLRLDARAARAVLLAAQALDRRPRRRARKPDVLAAIRRMGALQIDTIHVVARSPYLVLWSRLGAYDPDWLDALLEEGALFEYWAHEACFLPIEDYALFRHDMLQPEKMGWKYRPEWVARHPEQVAEVLEHVRREGAVRSAEFTRSDGKSGAWWGWKPEKRALEALFTAGELMVARRHNFQRVYDLRERVLPGWDDAALPSRQAVARLLALKAVRALGVTTARRVGDYFRRDRRHTATLVERLARDGELLRVEVDGWSEPGFAHPENRTLLTAAADRALRPRLTTLLSPFDPIVWDRDRAAALFAFEYRLECYTPAPKRRYGYFSLPILRRDALVGRLDAKAHRRTGVFEVKSLHLEPGAHVTDRMLADIAGAIRECAAWHETPEVTLRRTSPPAFRAPLARLLTA